MLKPIYKNYKTGKYYTIHENEEGQNELKIVFVDDNVFDSSEIKIDKNGKAYKVLNVEEHTTKNGFKVFRYKRG